MAKKLSGTVYRSILYCPICRNGKYQSYRHVRYIIESLDHAPSTSIDKFKYYSSLTDDIVDLCGLYP